MILYIFNMHSTKIWVWNSLSDFTLNMFLTDLIFNMININNSICNACIWVNYEIELRIYATLMVKYKTSGNIIFT